MSEVVTLNDVLEGYKEKFINALVDERIDFNAEIHFAYQSLMNNDYLISVARKNPRSLENAIINIAAVGLSLNPVEQLAYLVPRTVNKQPSVCLDISYKGLVRAATESGSIMWAQAEIVYESEDVHIERINEPPIHKRNPFAKEKGAIVGAYVVAKTSHDDYLTTFMSIAEIYEIRNKSEAFKKGYGPWIQFETEMIKKTVVKRASKMWPRTPKFERVDRAVSVVNEHEGIDFEAEKRELLEDKSNLDEDFPRDPESMKFGPNFIASWGKFRGVRLGDCNKEELEKYLDFLIQRQQKNNAYRCGEKFETFTMIEDYLKRIDEYSQKVKDETLDELMTVEGVENYDENYLENLTEGEARNLIEGK